MFSAFCLLALATVAAAPADLTKDPLVESVAQELAQDLLATVNFAKSDNTKTPQALVNEALNPAALQKVRDKMSKLSQYPDVDKVVAALVSKVAWDYHLVDTVMGNKTDIAPRAVGATVMGLLQLLSDRVKMCLTRY